MATTDNFNIGDIVNFDVYPTAILGSGYKNVTVESIINYNTAKRLGFDADAVHANVYPTLPAGTPNKASDYLYLVIKHVSGNTEILGLPWINEATLVQVQYTTVRVLVPNAGAADIEKISKALLSNGFTPSSIELV